MSSSIHFQSSSRSPRVACGKLVSGPAGRYLRTTTSWDHVTCRDCAKALKRELLADLSDEDDVRQLRITIVGSHDREVHVVDTKIEDFGEIESVTIDRITMSTMEIFST